MKELDNLANKINEEYQLSLDHANIAIQHSINAGKMLIEAKKKCKYGEWGTWCKTNLVFTQSYACRLMGLPDLKCASNFNSTAEAFAYMAIERKEERDFKKEQAAKEKRAREEARKVQEEAVKPSPEPEPEPPPKEEPKQEQTRHNFDRMSLKEALAVTGIQPTTWETVDIVIKALLHRNHPDKGGDREKFELIKKAQVALEINYKPRVYDHV